MNERLKNILFPTLIAALYQDELNSQILEEDMSLDLVKTYIQEYSSINNTDEDNAPPILPPHFRLEFRIPDFVQTTLLEDL